MISQRLKNKLVHSDVSKIFFITVSLFLFVLVVKIYFLLNDYKQDWFAQTFYPFFGIKNNTQEALQHAWVFLSHFWIEGDFRDLLSNILWLYFFGFILEENSVEYTVFFLYIIAGIVGGLVVIACVQTNPQFLPKQFYLGMKAPLFAIATATVAMHPKRKVFESFNGGIPIYIVGIVFALLTSLSVANAGLAPMMAIVSGAMVGLLYRFGLDAQIEKWQAMIAAWQMRREAAKKSNVEVKENIGYKVVEVSQEKIDELLDKINRSGMQSLTAQEKEWLRIHSSKM
jgi:membrane associated rhomboid family serine protease